MKYLRKQFDRRSNRGVTLVEVLFALAVSAIIAVSGMYWMNRNAAQLRSKGAADQLNIVADAAASYVHNNYAALETSIATAGGKMALSLQPLRDAGYLPADSFTSNPYGASYEIWLRESGVGPNTSIEAMVVAAGGYDPGEVDLPNAAIMAGGKSGFVKPANPNTVLGAYGGWRASLTDFKGASASSEPVRLASIVHFNRDQVMDDYLYRYSVDGHPEVNTMNTDIDMGGQDGYTASAVKNASGFRISVEKPSTRSDEKQGALVFGDESSNSSFHFYKQQGGGACNGGDCLVFDGNSGAGKFVFGNGEDTFIPSMLVDTVASQVAINTNNPSSDENLFVEGTSRVTDKLSVGSAEGDERLVVEDNARVTGNLNVGAGDPSGDQLWVEGSAQFNSTINANGSITSQDDIEAPEGSMRARAFYYVSDGRLKKDVHTLEDALERLLKVRGVKYRWKRDGSVDYGLIAQDVAEVYPELVRMNDDGMLAVEYGSMVGPIIEAIRQLHQQNLELRAALGTPGANAWNRPRRVTPGS